MVINIIGCVNTKQDARTSSYKIVKMINLATVFKDYM
jgi:hypothetical protein